MRTKIGLYEKRRHLLSVARRVGEMRANIVNGIPKRPEICFLLKEKGVEEHFQEGGVGVQRDGVEGEDDVDGVDVAV